MSTKPEDLEDIVDQAAAAYGSVLKSYHAATMLLIGKWTGDDWSPDEKTTTAIVEAVQTTSASAGAGVRLSREWLAVASQLEDPA